MGAFLSPSFTVKIQTHGWSEFFVEIDGQPDWVAIISDYYLRAPYCRYGKHKPASLIGRLASNFSTQPRVGCVPVAVPAPTTTFRCECGAEATGSNAHSSWCPKE